MGILEAIVLGIVQGFTEFLPVSSSGHLVLFQNIFGIEGDLLFFDTMLHVGTLVAVVVVLRKDIMAILRHPIQKLTGMLIVATIPAVVFALLFNDFFTGAFEGGYLAFGFMVTALLLTLAELISEAMTKKKNHVTYGNAVAMGVLQGVAIMPGISRSGSTMVGGLLCGIDRSMVARFSFLMSIPVILGSLVLQSYQLFSEGAHSVYLAPTIIGTLFPAASGYFAVRFMLNLITKKKLYGFAIYTGALGVLVLLDQLVFNVVFANPFV